MNETVRTYDVGGLKLSLSEMEGLNLTKILSQMSTVPDLKSMIKTDAQGLITYFEPKDISWGFIFLVQNLMIAQRLRLMDDFMKAQGIIK